MANEMTGVPDLTGVKILVAEDDEYSLRMLELLLEETNAELLFARDGKKAMDLFRSNDIDLAILDIRLPEMDGIQILTEMLKEKSDIYAIAQSAYALDSDREKGLMLGFKEYILKPVDQETLFKALNNFRISRSHAEIRIPKTNSGNIFPEHIENFCESIPAYVAVFNEELRIKYANRLFRERFGNPEGKGCVDFFSKLSIQELQERTEDLNLAQSVGHIGSWRLKIPSNELQWSKETYNLFEVPENEPLNYEKFLSFVHPADREYVNLKWENALKGEEYDIEHRILVNGKVKWVLEKAVLETDPENKLLSGFGVVQDITELRQMTEKLKQSEEELRLQNNNLSRLNAMLEDFVSIAAHDLRSPVASMKALSLLIDNIPDISQKARFFDEMMLTVNRLESTVEGLMETVNIQKKDDTPSKKINLKVLLEQVLSGISELVNEKQALITHDFSDDTYVVYIEAYILSLFSNLINNAIKYSSPERKPELKISSLRSDNYFVLTFSDNGIGIDLEKAGKNIFRPFKRFTDIAPGTGMGLYLIKNILEKNGGYIEVSSVPGEGTTFICYLKEYKEVD